MAGKLTYLRRRAVLPISVLVLVVAAVLGAAHGAPAAVTADLAATVTGPGVAGPGSLVTFNFSARNNGPGRAENVIVRNTLTSGATTFVSIAAPAGWSCNVPGLGASADSLSCSAPGLDAGGLAQFALVVRISTSATGTISEAVRVSSSTSDRNVANDTSTATVRVVPSADLSVSLSGPASAPAGTLVAYYIAIRNNWPSVAHSIRLLSPIPAQTTYSRSFGSGCTCTFFSSRTPTEIDCTGSVGAVRPPRSRLRSGSR